MLVKLSISKIKGFYSVVGRIQVLGRHCLRTIGIKGIMHQNKGLHNLFFGGGGRRAPQRTTAITVLSHTTRESFICFNKGNDIGARDQTREGGDVSNWLLTVPCYRDIVL